MRAQLASVRLKRLMVSAAIVQDMADSLLALNDIQGTRDQCKQPGCGLAAIRRPMHVCWQGLSQAGHLDVGVAPFAACLLLCHNRS